LWYKQIAGTKEKIYFSGELVISTLSLWYYFIWYVRNNTVRHIIEW
jgi:hypothetical protein